MENARMEEIRAHFAAKAQSYDQETQWRQHSNILNAIARLAAGSYALAIDIGTGTGIVAALISRYSQLTIGLDICFDMLKVARSRIQRIVQGDACMMPFRDQSIDCCTARQVLHYVNDEGLIGELARILRPGGCIVLADVVVSDPKDLTWWREIKALVQPLRRRVYGPDCHEGLLSKSFFVREQEDISIWRYDPWSVFLKHISKDQAAIRHVHQLVALAVAGELSFVVQTNDNGIGYTQNWLITRAIRR